MSSDLAKIKLVAIKLRAGHVVISAAFSLAESLTGGGKVLAVAGRKVFKVANEVVGKASKAYKISSMRASGVTASVECDKNGCVVYLHLEKGE